MNGVHAELRLEHGIHVGKKRVERLMAAHDLSGRAPRLRGRTTVRVAGVLQIASANPTPHGYTWSLLLFLIPIGAIAGWLLPGLGARGGIQAASRGDHQAQ